MPYFSWVGINITGNLQRGRQVARDVELLKEALLQKQIALLKAKELTNSFFMQRLSYKHLNQINSQLSLLLESGIRLTQSLEIMSEIAAHSFTASLLAECARAVREGESFSRALDQHTPLIDRLMVTIITVAEKTGTLAPACGMLSSYYEEQGSFREQIKRALFLPMLTVFLFLLSTVGIFLCVIPRFEHLFMVINKDPGSVTKALFTCSYYLKHSPMFWALLSLLLALTCFLFVWFKKNKPGLMGVLFLKIYLLKTLVVYYNGTLFLQALSMLLQNGTSLVQALLAAKEVVPTLCIREKIEQIAVQVQSGISFSEACSCHPELFFKHAQALFALGEATGILGTTVEKASSIYKSELNALLNKCIKGIPIVCLLLLAVLISLLVVAIYTPLLTLSRVIS